MGNMEQHLGNTTSSTLLHQLRGLWKSPRGTVLRIETLTLMAIALSFFLAAFGSCRRWSNRWIVQKGFFAANSLSLSLGTYCIGLMQSSSVKSEMYPIWSVSLLTLLSCIDPITSYSLDYKNQLSKMLYQICLYCGYVLLISISTVSSSVGNIAIGIMSAITFINGFHKSLALVQQGSIQNIAREIEIHMIHLSSERNVDYRTEDLHGYRYMLLRYIDKDTSESSDSEKPMDKHNFVLKLFVSKRRSHYCKKVISIDQIWQCEDYDVNACKDVCLSFSLSRLLQRRFFGFKCAESVSRMTHDFVFKGLLHKRDGVLDYKRAFKVIEVELAFIYDTFFTSKSFLRLYQAKATSIWASASIIGICFVVLAAITPGMSTSHSGSTIVVDTTTTDLTITLIILAMLALVQVLQLIRCWTSNWSRIAFVFCYMRNRNKGIMRMTPGMRLRALLTRINCFDNYIWQNKLGQYSFVESISLRKCNLLRPSRCGGYFCSMFGLHFIGILLQEMWGKETGYAIELHADVQESIAEFLHKKGNYCRDDGSTFLDESGIGPTELPRILVDFSSVKIIKNILAWHIGTCYCELAQRKKGCIWFREGGGNEDFVDEEERKCHGVATALSKYYAYLMVSAPQLVFEDSNVAKGILRDFSNDVKWYLHENCGKWEARRRRFLCGTADKLEAMRSLESLDNYTYEHNSSAFRAGVDLGKQLEVMPRRWKILADFWVEALLYAVPSDNAEEHITRLSQGGEFITHLWALLSHAGILNKRAEEEPQQARDAEAIV